MSKQVEFIKQHLRRIILGLQILILVTAGLAPMILFGTSYAAGVLSTRSLTISTAVSSASATWTFGFKLGTNGNTVQGIQLQACTTAINSCTAPSTSVFGSASYGSQTGWAGAVNFAKDASGANDCTAGTGVLCLKRTDATAENNTTAKTIVINSATNPNTANTTWFVRITTYTTSTWTAVSIVDQGTVAASTAQTLTVNATVAEVLAFCVGSTSVNDATTNPGATCANISGTSVNLGALDSGNVEITPVSTNGGDSKNGIAMLRTNAPNGATVSYKAVQQAGTNHQGTLRVSGATCTAGASNTDQCIDAKGTTQGTLTNATESFGMTIAAVNCGSTTSYTCTFSTGAYNLTRDANYDGTGANTYPTDSGAVAGTTNAGYAWDETGTAAQIATSSGSTTAAVDDEALILKFAATPSIITPTGSYTAQADFIATPTY